NWFAGAGTGVGANQYDFQTVVTHELGHALGLGHSADVNSVMAPTLGTGQARRNLSVADLAIPDVCTGPCGLHVAGWSGAPLCAAAAVSVPEAEVALPGCGAQPALAVHAGLLVVPAASASLLTSAVVHDVSANVWLRQDTSAHRDLDVLVGGDGDSLVVGGQG